MIFFLTRTIELNYLNNESDRLIKLTVKQCQLITN